MAQSTDFTNRFSRLRDSSVGQVLKGHCMKPGVQFPALRSGGGAHMECNTPGRRGRSQVQGHSLLGGEFEASLRCLSQEKVKKLIFYIYQKNLQISIYLKKREKILHNPCFKKKTKLVCIKICMNKYVQIHRLGNLFLQTQTLRSSYDLHNATFLVP